MHVETHVRRENPLCSVRIATTKEVKRVVLIKAGKKPSLEEAKKVGMPARCDEELCIII